jgi:hypothetical protein
MSELTYAERSYDHYVTVGRFEEEMITFEIGVTVGILADYLTENIWTYLTNSDYMIQGEHEALFMDGYYTGRDELRFDYTAEELLTWANEIDSGRVGILDHMAG